MQESEMDCRNIVQLGPRIRAQHSGSVQTTLCKTAGPVSGISLSRSEVEAILAVSAQTDARSAHVPAARPDPHLWLISVIDDLINYCDNNGLTSTSVSMRYLKADISDEVLENGRPVDKSGFL